MRVDKPYLLSIGFGMPLFGIWGHKYIPIKRKKTQKHLKFLGFQFVWTSYKRLP